MKCVQFSLTYACSGGASAVVTVSVDGQSANGGSAGVIVYTGGTSQISDLCRPEKSGECFDCCQGFEFAPSAISIMINIDAAIGRDLSDVISPFCR